MFARRDKRKVLSRIRYTVWPQTGLRRAWSYSLHRLKRLEGSPYAIAAGFACGAGISFTPFIGFHFILAACLAWLIRGNIIASAFGTVVGNPWTFPLIFSWIYLLGTWLIGTTGTEDIPPNLTLESLLERPWEIFVPMALGGVLTGLFAWAVFFFPLKALIARYQAHRQQRLALAKRNKTQTTLTS